MRHTPRIHRTWILGLLLSACGTSQQAPADLAASQHALADRKLARGGPDADEEAARAQPAPPATTTKSAERLMAPSVASVRPSPSEAEGSTEAYAHVAENGFVSVANAPLSTFSIDVDTASYANVRRFLQSESLPPAGAVRIEELINYFDYDYPAPRDGEPLSLYTEVAPAPWAPEHRLLHIGLRGREIAVDRLPPRNLVFLLDVSGSMSDANKLPLLKRSFSALLSTLGREDRVAIVVYAGASGLVLPPTSGEQKSRILEALERLEAGGSTNGGEGIELAYRVAEQAFLPGGVNRVILATDGDFNVGTTSESELVRVIERKRDSGVFLTVLGYGMGNYKDSTLEKLADHGNGNYAYIDSFAEAQKVLVREGGANLVTIAQDVKIQVEMNPRLVGAYRLIGYENRRLATEDFTDDRKDAGEVGAGHTVTALYELLDPAQARAALPSEGLRYQRPAATTGSDAELCNVKLRFKRPLERSSHLAEFPVLTPAHPRTPSENFRFAAAVASFGMLLRGSEHGGGSSYPLVSELVAGATGKDTAGYRREFGELVRRADALSRAGARAAR